MFYYYTIAYANGTRLSGFVMSEKSEDEVRSGIRKQFFGNFRVTLKAYGRDFPRCNSDYIMTI